MASYSREWSTKFHFIRKRCTVPPCQSKFSQMDRLEERLFALDCHFNWIAEVHLNGNNLRHMLSYLLQGYVENKDNEVLARPFIAFLQCMRPEPDLETALEEIDVAIQLCQHATVEKDPDRCLGYELVALGNKAHILHALNKQPECENALKEIAAVQAKREGNDKMEASVIGIKAFAYFHLIQCFKTALTLFREAVRLDPDNYQWPLKRGVVAGRLKRTMKQVSTDYDTMDRLEKEQEESLLRAVEMTNHEHPNCLTDLGDVYYWRGRKIGNRARDEQLLKKAEELYRRSYELKPDSPQLLKRIGKAFPEIDPQHVPFAEKCLLRGEELNPRNSMLLHRMGQFYERVKNDFYKAEKYYQEAVTAGVTRNLYAELDLTRLRSRLDPNYDELKNMRDLLAVYADDHSRVIINQHLVVLKTKLIELNERVSDRERFLRELSELRHDSENRGGETASSLLRNRNRDCDGYRRSFQQQPSVVCRSDAVMDWRARN